MNVFLQHVDLNRGNSACFNEHNLKQTNVWSIIKFIWLMKNTEKVIYKKQHIRLRNDNTTDRKWHDSHDSRLIHTWCWYVAAPAVSQQLRASHDMFSVMLSVSNLYFLSHILTVFHSEHLRCTQNTNISCNYMQSRGGVHIA